MPTPRPDRPVTTDAVENPGAKIEVNEIALAHAGERVRRDHVALQRDLPDPVHVEAGPIVAHVDHHVLVLARAPQANRRHWRLVRGSADCCRFDAVIHRIPDDVQERLEQHVHDHPVSFRLPTFHDKARRFAELCRHLPHQARKALEHALERPHAHGEHRSLQLRDEPVQRRLPFLEHGREGICTVLRELCGMAECVLRHRQLSREIDERVDARRIDPQRARRGFLAGGQRGMGRRGSRCRVTSPLIASRNASALCFAEAVLRRMLDAFRLVQLPGVTQHVGGDARPLKRDARHHPRTRRDRQ